MAKHSFFDDRVSHTAVRYILIFELAVLVPVVSLVFTPYAPLGLCIAFLAMASFWAVLLWLYSRYQGYPLVKEKGVLSRQANSLRAKIGAEAAKIELARQTREKLLQAQRDESAAVLRSLQETYIKNGLAQARITEAQIAGVGPKLKERLALHGITNAANINPATLGSVSGFGEAKKQAVLTWRNSIYSRLNQARPIALAPEQAGAIQHKFETQHAANDAAEREARARKLTLDSEFSALQPRLHELSPITFRNYLWQIFSAQRVVAGIMAATLVISQICLLSSASMGALAISIPTETPTPTVDVNAIQTATMQAGFEQATQTVLAMPTETATITLTPTVTITFTPGPTGTKTPTPTRSPRPTRTLRPTRTPGPVIPTISSGSGGGGGGGGNCDPSYPTVCIPPAPPDLDCKDIPYRRFTVLPPDPHNFDGDGDGIGCESK